MASVAATIPAFQQLKSIKAHSDNVNTLVFSDDGKFLASGGDDGYIHIFTTKDWQEFRKYKAVSPVRVMIWHPGSSNVIAAGLKNGIVNTIQVKVGFNNVKWEHSVKGTVHCMSFRGHDKLLAVGFNNQVLVAKQTLLCMQCTFIPSCFLLISELSCLEQ
ncbi:WD40-repeat-containing domain protein [Mycena vulgaris]|nr:WD40-repeat-containing domain protein [Mycena vulgaris]